MKNTKKQTGKAPELGERQASGIEPQANTEVLPEAKPEAASPMRVAGGTRWLFCALTESEQLKKARELVKAQRALQDLSYEKKEALRDFTAKIERATEQRDALLTIVSEGKEQRSVEIEYELNSPKPGLKSAYRKDTGEQIGIQDMCTDDFEQDLPGIEDFPEEADAEEEPLASGVEAQAESEVFDEDEARGNALADELSGEEEDGEAY